MRSDGFDAKLNSAINAAGRKASEANAARQAYDTATNEEKARLQGIVEGLETDLATKEAKLAELERKIANPPQKQVTVKDDKGDTTTKMVTDQEELNRLKTQRDATQEQIAAAKPEVQTAKNEATAYAQARVLAELPDSEKAKMQEVFNFVDTLIAKEQAGEYVSEEELDQAQAKMDAVNIDERHEDTEQFWNETRTKLESLTGAAAQHDEEVRIAQLERERQEAEVQEQVDVQTGNINFQGQNQFANFLGYNQAFFGNYPNQGYAYIDYQNSIQNGIPYEFGQGLQNSGGSTSSRYQVNRSNTSGYSAPGGRTTASSDRYSNNRSTASSDTFNDEPSDRVRFFENGGGTFWDRF